MPRLGYCVWVDAQLLPEHLAQVGLIPEGGNQGDLNLLVLMARKRPKGTIYLDAFSEE